MDTKSNAWGFGFFVVFNNFMFLWRENASLSEKYILQNVWMVPPIGGRYGWFHQTPSSGILTRGIGERWWSADDDQQQMIIACMDAEYLISEMMFGMTLSELWQSDLQIGERHCIDGTGSTSQLNTSTSASFCCRKVAFTYVSNQTDIDGLMREGQTFQVSADDCSRYRRMVNSAPFRLFL